MISDLCRICGQKLKDEGDYFDCFNINCPSYFDPYKERNYYLYFDEHNLYYESWFIDIGTDKLYCVDNHNSFKRCSIYYVNKDRETEEYKNIISIDNFYIFDYDKFIAYLMLA